MCLACVNLPSNCSSCTSVSNLSYFLQPTSTSCLATCPTGYYGDVSGFSCLNCDSRCSACTGSTNGTCSACKVDSSGTAHFLIPNTTSCSTSCPDALYTDSSTFKC